MSENEKMKMSLDNNSSAQAVPDAVASLDETTPATDKIPTRQKILETLNGDLLAVDLLWSLFMAALNSYRHDTVLRPFPPMFQKGENKDMKSLENIAVNLPMINDVQRRISMLDEVLVELLWWALDKKQFTLKSLGKDGFKEIQQLTQHSVDAPTPNFIFEINYSESANRKFEEFRKERQLMYAYHGSRIENFHSILHHGLASHMNKTSLFGEGTYLSSELSVSLPYSPGGLGWDNSLLGDRLSCVAVCQIIDDSSVKCQLKQEANKGTQPNRRTMAPSSMGGEVPEKYYVVTNNDMLRVKYLLVYGEKSCRKRTQEGTSWLYRHKFMVMITIYAFVLVMIGLANSKSFQYHLRRFLRGK